MLLYSNNEQKFCSFEELAGEKWIPISRISSCSLHVKKTALMENISEKLNSPIVNGKNRTNFLQVLKYLAVGFLVVHVVLFNVYVLFRLSKVENELANLQEKRGGLNFTNVSTNSFGDSLASSKEKRLKRRAVVDEEEIIVDEEITVDVDQKKVSQKRGRKKSSRRNRSKRSVVGALHLHYAHSPQEQKTTLQVLRTEEPLGPWTIAPNTSKDHHKFAQLENSAKIRVTKSGLYWLYAQFTYFDRTGRWAHVIEINGNPFIKCVSSESGIDADPVTNVYYNTIHHCYTAAPHYLHRGDRLTIRGLYPDRNITLETLMTFWGIVKLA